MVVYVQIKATIFDRLIAAIAGNKNDMALLHNQQFVINPKATWSEVTRQVAERLEWRTLPPTELALTPEETLRLDDMARNAIGTQRGILEAWSLPRI